MKIDNIYNILKIRNIKNLNIEEIIDMYSYSAFNKNEMFFTNENEKKNNVYVLANYLKSLNQVF